MNERDIVKNVIKSAGSLYGTLAKITGEFPDVYCRHCGMTTKADAARSFRRGWPKCCGYTMTLDKPKEGE